MMAAPPRQGSWSVYVHFPWCLKRCSYCDFATAVADVIPRSEYTAAILTELRLRTAELRPAPVRTVFFGGGTPSLWGPAHVGAVLQWLADWGGLAPDAEITLEANPGATEAAELRAYASAGINRVSVGVQALDDHRLRKLDRLHDAGTARHTLGVLRDLLQEGRLRSASADLMFGAPGQGLTELRSDVEGVLSFNLPHLSAYALTVEEGTPLATRVERGLQTAPDDDLQADMLAALPDWLADKGLRRYEVSNFARSGHASQHNLTYWRGGHWLAVGVGAHGHVPSADGDVRYGNTRKQQAYLQALGEERLAEVLTERVDAETLLVERVLTELRLSEGIDLQRLRADAGADRVARLLARAAAIGERGEQIVWDDKHLRVLPAAVGRLDAIIRALT